MIVPPSLRFLRFMLDEGCLRRSPKPCKLNPVRSQGVVVVTILGKSFQDEGTKLRLTLAVFHVIHKVGDRGDLQSVHHVGHDCWMYVCSTENLQH